MRIDKSKVPAKENPFKPDFQKIKYSKHGEGDRSWTLKKSKGEDSNWKK